MKKGDEVEQTVTAPEDFADERLKGKPIVYKVSVTEIKEEILADEDDAFAKQVSEDFENVAALRERVREDIQKAQDDTELRDYEAKILDALTDVATVEFAQVMVDHEIEHILEEQANLDPRDPRAVDIYIARMGKSEEEVKEQVRPDAELRLKRSLVLSKFAETEGIKVEEEDVQAEIEQMASTAGEQADLIRTIFNGEQGRQNIERQLLTRKTFGRLVEIADAGGAPAAAPKARASKKAAAESTATEPEASAAESEASEGDDAEKKPSKARRSSPRKAE
jgi:trigger factor